MLHAQRTTIVSRIFRSITPTKALATGALLSLAATSTQAAYFANEVMDYTPGADLPLVWPTTTTYSQTSSALGSPFAIHGLGTEYPGVLSPFNSPYEYNEIVAIGEGGEITLQLERPVAQGAQFEIGVFTNVGLSDASYPDNLGEAGEFPFAFGVDSAIVSVSQNGTDFYPLNNANPITFDMPSNFYNNAGPFDPAAPANPEFADFGLPNPIADFTFFDNSNHASIIAELAGSAGGTWLNIEDANLPQVSFIRFSLPDDNDPNTFLNFDLDAVSINTSQALAIPEPTSLLLLSSLTFLGLTRRRK